MKTETVEREDLECMIQLFTCESVLRYVYVERYECDNIENHFDYRRIIYRYEDSEKRGFKMRGWILAAPATFDHCSMTSGKRGSFSAGE